jgi:putative endonuclease
MIESEDSSLYTGVTTNISRRFAEHTNGKAGAKYFKGRKPVAVVYSQQVEGRSEAQQREAAIKKLSRTEKLKLKQQVIFYQ